MCCASSGAADVTSRGAASLLEVGETVTGWPQLGSEVTLGAATAAAAVRRIGSARRPAVGPRPLRRRGGAVGHPAREVTVDDDWIEFDDDGMRDPTAYDVSLAKSDLPLPEGSDPIEIIVDAARLGPLGREHPAVAIRGRRHTRSACTSSPSARPPWTCGTGAATSPSAPRCSTPGWRPPR